VRERKVEDLLTGCVKNLIAAPSRPRQHASRIVEQVLDSPTKREIDMNIRKYLEQAAAALIYGMALVILGGGVSLMCVPVGGLIA
jgi:hypothetical protein